MKRILPFILFFLPLTVFSQSQQHHLRGKVVDAVSGEALAFVSIIANNSNWGCYSDIDGAFNLHSPEKIREIRLSYVGYEPMVVGIEKPSAFIEVEMQRAVIELQPVMIKPGINPAHRIIREVLLNRDIHDPEKLNSFSYTAYEKTVFTVKLDSLGHTDTAVIDTAESRVRKFLEKHDLAIIESVYERKYLSPGNNAQKVLANRISGFKDPIFTFLISQLQSTSFYREVISISDNNYINPISTGTFKKYYFQIEDTLIHPETADSTYIISFRPLLNRNFDGLKGVLYINTDGYAIENVIASPAIKSTGFGISIQQMYMKVDSVHWFPVQLNTDLDIAFVQMYDSVAKKSYNVKGIGKTYLKDIVINGSMKRKDFSHVELDVDPRASAREEAYWAMFRNDTLSQRDRRTYEFLDSIGEAENLDKRLKSFESMITGKIPLGYADIDINRLLRFNDHEGWYFGLGLSTSSLVSRRFKAGAYVGYGLKDTETKYGGFFDWHIYKPRELTLSLSYRHDVGEAAGVSLTGYEGVAVYERFRNYLIEKMDRLDEKQALLSIRFMKWYKGTLGVQQQLKTPGYDYTFGPEDLPQKDTFNFGSLVVALRFAYKERFLKNARTQISMGTNYPVGNIQYVRGLDGFLGGEFDFHRVDFRVSQSFYMKYFGRTSLTLRAGWIEGELPYSELYNGNGSFRQFMVYAPVSFATMRMNEFLSDRYAALYFTHSFGSLLIRKKHFAPEIALATNIAIGSLARPALHHYVETASPEKGYFESGLMLNKILNLGLTNLGLGAFYRYGDYAFAKWQNNLSWKFSVVLPF